MRGRALAWLACSFGTLTACTDSTGLHVFVHRGHTAPDELRFEVVLEPAPGGGGAPERIVNPDTVGRRVGPFATDPVDVIVYLPERFATRTARCAATAMVSGAAAASAQANAMVPRDGLTRVDLVLMAVPGTPDNGADPGAGTGGTSGNGAAGGGTGGSTGTGTGATGGAMAGTANGSGGANGGPTGGPMGGGAMSGGTSGGGSTGMGGTGDDGPQPDPACAGRPAGATCEPGHCDKDGKKATPPRVCDQQGRCAKAEPVDCGGDGLCSEGICRPRGDDQDDDDDDKGGDD